ncbi:electron transport complex subunit RsxG [Rhodocyclus purpureus]|uniref:electron transport complex subunit RsxG n=1 Tax=Rhodocyclus purpureus TaxID=1067 RepID=UPI001F5C89A2|nr:electron transport complex subunit RsxG [Rhodocyclus purpureus]
MSASPEMQPAAQAKAPSAPAMAARSALILIVFVAVFTGLLAAAYLRTKPALEATALAEKTKLIDEVLPKTAYDNDPLKDAVQIAAVAALGLDEPSTVYRARRAGEPAAAVVEAVAADGYSGRIRLLLAIAADGTVLGVRVTEHRETPGLGDYIEPKKDKNKARPWISQFNGLSPATLSERDWRVKKDGGRFDSVAGATVTPRAVVKAVRKAALWVADNREQVFQ